MTDRDELLRMVKRVDPVPTDRPLPAALSDLRPPLALLTGSSEPAVARGRGLAIAAGAAAVALAVGLPVLMLWGGGDDETAASTVPEVTATVAPLTTAAPSTTVPAAVAAEPPPAVWGRVPSQSALRGVNRITLSGVTTWPGGLLAVGGEAAEDGGSDGVVLTSPDGVAWTELHRAPGLWLGDVASGAGGVAITGLQEADDPVTGVPMGVVATSLDGASWSVTPLPIGDDAAFGMVNTVTAWGGGFVAAGSEVEPVEAPTSGGDRARAAIWRSGDGVAWERAGSFPWVHDASVEDVIAADGLLVAVGFISEEEMASRPAVWVSSDGVDWSEQVIGPAGDGFTGMSGVALGEDGFVAVGFAPATGGTTGAVWVSGKGLAWEAVADPEGVLLGEPNAATRMHGVTAFGGGYVAVGYTLERPYTAYRIWTSDDGHTWRRFDLSDPGTEWATTAAFDVVATPGGVVMVGKLAHLDNATGEAAVWIGPPPEGVPVSSPLEPRDEPVAASSVSVTIDPPSAVAATRVWVRGRLTTPVDTDPMEVWLVREDGSSLHLCDATFVGAVFECRGLLGEMAPDAAPGAYGLAVGDPSDVVENVQLVVLPDGSRVVTLQGLYQATMWPLLTTVTVRNSGGDPLDLGGWTLADSGGGGVPFIFPDGTVVDPGTGFMLDFGGPGGGTCPEPTDRYLHWCRVVGDGTRIWYDDADLLWSGGDVELREPDGTVVAVWSVPR